MPDEQVFRVLLRMQAVQGREQDFESTWLEIGATVAGQPGNLGQWLMTGAEEPGVFYIISDWVDETHFRDFEHGPVNTENRRRLRPVRASVSMTTMRVVRFLPSLAGQQAAGGVRPHPTDRAQEVRP
jgi:heme-degrading monooxygenase HmoA